MRAKGGKTSIKQMEIAGEGVGDVVRFPGEPLGVMHDVVEDEERHGAGNSQLGRSGIGV